MFRPFIGYAAFTDLIPKKAWWWHYAGSKHVASIQWCVWFDVYCLYLSIFKLVTHRDDFNKKYENSPNNREYEYQYFEMEVQFSLTLYIFVLGCVIYYDGACSRNVCQNGVNFLRHLAGKKTWWQLASPCCWNRARRLTCFLSASVTRKDLQFGTWTDPSFQRHYRFPPTTLGSTLG